MGPVTTSKRPVYDQDGKLTGFEPVQRSQKDRSDSPLQDDYYYEIEKTGEPEATDAVGDAEDDEVDDEGMTEEDVQAEREEQEQIKQQRNQVMLEDWNAFVKETETMNEYLAKERLERLKEAIRERQSSDQNSAEMSQG